MGWDTRRACSSIFSRRSGRLLSIIDSAAHRLYRNERYDNRLWDIARSSKFKRGYPETTTVYLPVDGSGDGVPAIPSDPVAFHSIRLELFQPQATTSTTLRTRKPLL
jgi:hypothetical protein